MKDPAFVEEVAEESERNSVGGSSVKSVVSEGQIGKVRVELGRLVKESKQMTAEGVEEVKKLLAEDAAKRKAEVEKAEKEKPEAEKQGEGSKKTDAAEESGEGSSGESSSEEEE
ncbi:hypothetical protein NLI96_g12838 [Meripilus lineatus]|uniref:Uncharacterized protein n=1 Tax=Meripilus lineatus TaxID=2056292 RepID=A0AAD5UP30_9APHY|nr:hypothetical protein NLI96_g12838 [Physisporinus lineatus]